MVTEDGKPAAHFEHTVAVTEAGVDVLTDGRAPWRCDKRCVHRESSSHAAGANRRSNAFRTHLRLLRFFGYK